MDGVFAKAELEEGPAVALGEKPCKCDAQMVVQLYGLRLEEEVKM